MSRVSLRRIASGAPIFALALCLATACQPVAVAEHGAGEHAAGDRAHDGGPVEVTHVPPPGGGDRPWSNAVAIGDDLLFLAGKLGTDAEGNLVPGGIQPETRQTMENIKAIVEANGSDMSRIAKCTVFLADMAEWAAMNEVYVTYFPEGKRPARSAIAVAGLARDARVEIECIAVRK